MQNINDKSIFPEKDGVAQSGKQAVNGKSMFDAAKGTATQVLDNGWQS